MSRIHVLCIFTLSALACGDHREPSEFGTGIEGVETNDEVGESGQANTGDTTEAPTSTDGDDEEGTDGQSAKFDVLEFPDGGGGGTNCGGFDGDETHSYIWIANSDEDTMSKINTQTLVEEARYLTSGSSGNPSRTSVSLSGNVAVANRNGGVAKFYANIDDCKDVNGVPGIQTSTGATDILPWGQDECLAWYKPFGYTTQRPVAWVQGEFNPDTCAYENEKLWTAGSKLGNTEVLLMNGDDGSVEQTVAIANVVGWAGLYGGAVDGDGNFWTIDHSWGEPSTLIRVDRQSFGYDAWPVDGEVHYGITVDSKGRAWLCGNGGASRFDPSTETWAHLPPIHPGSAQGGCMEDAEGVLWTGSHPDAQLVGIDTETVQIVQTIPTPEYVHGVSIDFEGHIWGVEYEGTHAYRVDPETLQVDTVSGLVGAYTYSDMTGFAISTAGTPAG